MNRTVPFAATEPPGSLLRMCQAFGAGPLTLLATSELHDAVPTPRVRMPRFR